LSLISLFLKTLNSHDWSVDLDLPIKFNFPSSGGSRKKIKMETKNITKSEKECDCSEHGHVHENSVKKPKEDKITLFKAHINKLKPEQKKLVKEAWRNQEGICIFSERVLRKSKIVVGFFEPADPSKFNDMKVLTFLIGEDYLETPKDFLEKSLLNLAYSLFGLTPGVRKIKPLTLQEKEE